MLDKGNHPQMAELFRLVKYCNLPRTMCKPFLNLIEHFGRFLKVRALAFKTLSHSPYAAHLSSCKIVLLLAALYVTCGFMVACPMAISVGLERAKELQVSCPKMCEDKDLFREVPSQVIFDHYGRNYWYVLNSPLELINTDAAKARGRFRFVSW